MNRCETCKHWTESNQWDVKAGGLRECGAVQPKWVVEDQVPEALQKGRYGFEGDGAQAAYETASTECFKKAMAVVNDGSQYIAVLLTRPEFGCVLHSDQSA